VQAFTGVRTQIGLARRLVMPGPIGWACLHRREDMQRPG
jgi:hypothetical protein